MSLTNYCRHFGHILAATAISVLGLSCIEIDGSLGENFIPDDQKWRVYSPEAVAFKTGSITLQMSDSLSAYSSKRMVVGSVLDAKGGCLRSTSITLVPLDRNIDLGKNTKVKNFHFTAVKDTLSTVYDRDERILQNIYVSALKKPVDSTLYGGAFMNMSPDLVDEYLDRDNLITKGIPVYNGGDSLSFDFTKEFAEDFVSKLANLTDTERDSLHHYVKKIPGIYITTDERQGTGGRINMFDVTMEVNSSTYMVSGNYAKLSISADYDDRVAVDTSFLFIFGPTEFVADSSATMPAQMAYNCAFHSSNEEYGDNVPVKNAGKEIIVEGGFGVKPVIKARAIKEMIEEMEEYSAITDPSQVVINKASIILPYDPASFQDGWSDLDRFPVVLSPTVKLRSTDNQYVTYAGLTDASIESENQGEINRSMCWYSPDMSHHIQEILKQDDENLDKYDIWLLIMHEEVTESSSSSNMNDYYNNLMYNSYYNNMMYDPYSYGYGGYGYGYGSYGYGYGYNNYYNYMMMAAYASSGSTTTSTTSTELDRDRYYNCTLCGPEYPEESLRPRLRITFSVPKVADSAE